MQTMRRAALGAISLCAAVYLTGCGLVRPVSDPEVLRITHVEYVPVPAALTVPTPDPTAPLPLCVDDQGPLLCNGQLEDWRLDYSGALGRCNADKAAIATLEQPQ